MEATSIAKKNCLSPLRYPGGKRKLVPLVIDIFKRAPREIDLLIEPFAGGAAVSIAFLESGLAKRIALSDLDDLVASFWKVVFSEDAEELARLVETTTITLKLWNNIKRDEPVDEVLKAYKCLFLNRTSFSGILHDKAGPIGGQSQSSRYKIGCRFNKSALARRIRELSKLRHRVLFVRHQSYKKTIADVNRMNIAKGRKPTVFWYIDPPFFKKADKLYRHCFNECDHLELKNKVFSNEIPGEWLLSYDDVAEARELYKEHGGFSRVNLAYNARIDDTKRLISTEIIVSNTIHRLRKKNTKGIPKMGKIIPIHGLLVEKNKDIKLRKQG